MVDQQAVAKSILRGFSDYRARYTAITVGARDRFVNARWGEVQRATRDRILLYKLAKLEVSQQLDAEQLGHVEVWPGIKAEYLSLLAARSDAVLAATFFNTIFRQMAGKWGLADDRAFLMDDPPGGIPLAEELSARYTGNRINEVIRDTLLGSELGESLTHLDRDIESIARRLTSDIPLLRESFPLELEVVRPVFYRNKGAYIVGRLQIDEHVFPLAIALRHDGKGVVADACIWGESPLSVIFSFTRSYFMISVDNPMQLVAYLQRLLPEKKRWELFTSIGFFKQGKTEFVRGYRRHLEESDDKFHIAEGIKGQVMMVFGLSSYQTVFKVLKDKFPATKSVTHDDVKAAYKLVKTHDRVGRMADTQEFRNFQFPRSRFEDELIAELLKVAPASIEIDDDVITIKHLYTERMMTPLNIYVQWCSEFQLKQVLQDYGRAIKELAAANIFPGDMLLKNFGVTRHGRVVFYDYDEICYLTDVNFRKMPQRAEGGMSAEPWFDVGEFDVFPEEFSTFLFPDDHMQSIFREFHADLFMPEGWIRIQEEVRANLMMDVFPYPDRMRLAD